MIASILCPSHAMSIRLKVDLAVVVIPTDLITGIFAYIETETAGMLFWISAFFA